MGATAAGRDRRNLCFMCNSAIQPVTVKCKGRRTKGKANFVRNAGAPLEMESVGPALNSSLHLSWPSHLLGHKHKEVETTV